MPGVFCLPGVHSPHLASPVWYLSEYRATSVETKNQKQWTYDPAIEIPDDLRNEKQFPIVIGKLHPYTLHLHANDKKTHLQLHPRV